MKASLLLIEDDAALRDLMETILRRADYEVWPAAHGREAMEIVTARTVDLVIADLVTPEAEGIETLLKIRRLRPATPMIALSGGGQLDPENALRIAETTGATRLLTKPFPPGRLLGLICEMLGEPVSG